jgi:hypothetical protein
VCVYFDFPTSANSMLNQASEWKYVFKSLSILVSLSLPLTDLLCCIVGLVSIIRDVIPKMKLLDVMASLIVHKMNFNLFSKEIYRKRNHDDL